MDKAIEREFEKKIKTKARLTANKCVQVMWELFITSEKDKVITEKFVEAMACHNLIMEQLAQLDELSDPLTIPLGANNLVS